MFFAAFVSLALAGRGPPAPSDKAATARWLVHEAQYVAQATNSVALKGFPFNNVRSNPAHTPRTRTPILSSPSSLSHSHAPHARTIDAINERRHCIT